MKGLLKMGCLRTSAWDAGSDFVRPILTLSQDPRMHFQNEHFNFLSLGRQRANLYLGCLALCCAPEDGPDLLGALESLSKVLLLGQDLSPEVWQVVLRIVPWGL
jgi:hypothetical protein